MMNTKVAPDAAGQFHGINHGIRINMIIHRFI